MRPIFRSLLVAALLVTGLVSLNWQVSQAQTAQTQQSTPTPTTAVPSPTATPTSTIPSTGQDDQLRTVSVNGQGQVNAAPDQVIVRLGVRTEAESASEALTENSEAMQGLLEALRSAGVSTADIQTQNIQLFPRYENPVDNPRGNMELVGYMAVNIAEVRVREVDNLGTLLDAAINAGGNTIEDIHFEVSDQSDLLDEARANAMNEARRKAEQLAELADATLGPIISIQETSYSPGPLYGRGGISFDEAQASVPVEPGQQTLTVDIMATWQLVPNASP